MVFENVWKVCGVIALDWTHVQVASVSGHCLFWTMVSRDTPVVMLPFYCFGCVTCKYQFYHNHIFTITSTTTSMCMSYCAYLSTYLPV